MHHSHQLCAINMGIDTHQEPVAYMRSDCSICHAEGFSASSRLTLEHNHKTIIATLNVVDDRVLPTEHIGLSHIAWQKLGLTGDELLTVRHAPVVSSTSSVRKKIYGERLESAEIEKIIADISAHRYADIEIASFLSICAGNRMDEGEIIALTRAMIDCGQRLHWPQQSRVFDKHCIGGLPGNRTTPLVISICSAAGLMMPKTSSRAITSPAGTADTMGVLTNVDLSLKQIQAVVDKTGACLAWGGAVNLSPADDVLIRIERALDLDGEGQLVASVLSKKIAAGSTHVLIDIPIGSTGKIRSSQGADRLADRFQRVGAALGIEVHCVQTDGENPIGRGIGPVEEARDVLAVLKNSVNAPRDLVERSLLLSAYLLAMDHADSIEEGLDEAREILSSGRALQQFEDILSAQGCIKELPEARFQQTLTALRDGIVTSIDNRRLARLAKLAGAPNDPTAGLRLQVTIGDAVTAGQPMATLCAPTVTGRWLMRSITTELTRICLRWEISHETPVLHPGRLAPACPLITCGARCRAGTAQSSPFPRR